MSLLAAAHENGVINFIDYNSNKIIKTINDAHSDSVSCIKFGQQNGGLNVISGSHDGSIKIWDLRNYQSIAEVSKAHGRKYDEGTLCLDTHANVPFFASGGADCIVNIYELNLN
jgi:striatin 1/3/4